jgi:nucleoid-associated protein YgaU
LTGELANRGAVAKVTGVARAVKGVTFVDDRGLTIKYTGASYTIVPGDTLSGIADRFYGRWWLWPLIMEANEGKISLSHLAPGTVILIPTIPD